MPAPSTPRAQLTLFDSICIIVGIVIGAGIYETTPVIARSVPDEGWLIALWIAGGLVSLIGASCYAELATAYPYEGGDYIYLTRAYGRRTGFLFTWMGFWLVNPANIGAIAYIFARYANQIWPLHGHTGLMIHAVTAVVILTIVNICGVASGKWTQNIVTSAKVLGLLVIIIIGLFVTSAASDHPPASTADTVTDPGLAMIMVLFTYGGWSNISFVAAEVRNPRKNILRALVLGTMLITAIYILVNLAFIHTLGYSGVANASSVATNLMEVYSGKTGSLLISALICITCLGNLNGMILTNARIYYALGQDHSAYRWLGVWHAHLDAPVTALVLQAVITLALIISLGHADNVFQRLVIFSAPVYWFFFALVTISLFILRRKDRSASRHYQVPYYPATPLLFTLVTCYMLYASMSYAWQHWHAEVYWIMIILCIGFVLSMVKK
jgi:amino acid transporter